MTKNGFLNKSESRYEMARLGKKRQNGVQIDKIEKKWVRIDQNGTKWPGYEMTGNWTNMYSLHVFPKCVKPDLSELRIPLWDCASNS